MALLRPKLRAPSNATPAWAPESRLRRGLRLLSELQPGLRQRIFPSRWAWLLASATLTFLAFALAGIAADDYLLQAASGGLPASPGVLWTAWAPLPLGLLAAILAFGAPPLPDLRLSLGLLGATLALLGLLGLRWWVAREGPVPYLAIRELTDITILGFSTIALATLGHRKPVLGLAVWIGTLAVIGLSRWRLSTIPLLFRPDLMPVLLSFLWALAVLSSHFEGTRPPRTLAADRRPGPRSGGHPGRRDADVPPSPAPVILSHLAAVGLGFLLAWSSLRNVRSIGDGPAFQTGERGRPFELLWMGSSIFGWGRSAALRLASTDTLSPQPFPTWMGWPGVASSWGISGLIGIALMALMTLGLGLRASRRGGSGLFIGQSPWLPIQALLGLAVMGGPNSSIPALLAGGWMALAVAGRPNGAAHLAPRGERAAPGEPRPAWPSLLVAVAALGLLAGLIPLTARPVAARGALARLKRPEDFRRPDLGPLLYRAEARDPWNPDVYRKRAHWLRERLAQAQAWDETLFQRIAATYEAALERDPYNIVTALELARILDVAGRVDGAIETAQRASRHNPASPELLHWLYLYSTRHGRLAVAAETIERGLALQPDAGLWWERRYRFEQAAGRGPMAGRSLHIALTAAMSDPSLDLPDVVQAAFERRAAQGDSEAPEPSPPGL